MTQRATWTNSDGLVVGFGARYVTSNLGTQARTAGNVQELVLEINGADLTDATVPAEVISGAYIPADSLIIDANLVVTTAFVGVNAVLDIGSASSAAAIVDDDGIDVAIATASLGDNVDIQCDGDLIGTVVTARTYIYASYDTAAFTAGYAKLVIRFMPVGPSS